MEQDYNKLFVEGKLQYDTAFHLIHGTYQFARDPKILLGIASNLSLAVEKVLEAVLIYERQLKIIPPYSDNFSSKFDLFQRKTAVRNNVPEELLDLILKLREIVQQHQTSPVEFKRQNQYVICSDKYNMQVLSLAEVQKYAQKTKEFISLAEGIITNLERK